MDDDSKPTLETCEMCGCTSPLSIAFKKVRVHGRLCPRCQQEVLTKGFYGNLLVILAGLLFLSVLCGGSLWRYAPLNLFLFVILEFAFLLAHELLHAVGAWLAGGRVFEIRVGLGDKVVDKRIGGLTVALHKIPVLGLCVFGFANEDRIKSRYILAIVSPLLMHAVLVAIFWPGFDLANLDGAIAIPELIFLINLFLLVANVIPRQINRGGVLLWSDGLVLAKLIRGQLKAGVLHAQYYLLASVYALAQQEYERMRQVSQDGLAYHPQHPGLRNNLALALLELQQHAEAAALFASLLESDEQELLDAFHLTPEQLPFFQALFRNNLAYALMLQGNSAGDMQEAYAYSKEAFSLVPWDPNIQGTWGAVLVESGEIETGIEHLLQASQYQVTPRSKAVDLAFAAIGYHRLDEKEKAAGLLTQAMQIHDNGYVIQKAKKVLASS